MSVSQQFGGRHGAPLLFCVLSLAIAACRASTPERSALLPVRELRLEGVAAIDLAVVPAADGHSRLYLADALGGRILVFSAGDGRALGEWPLRGEAESRTEAVALAAGDGWLLVAERAPARVRAFDPATGEVLAELPAAIGLAAPSALAAWPIRRGWHTVLVGDRETAAEESPAGAVRVWQARRRPNGRTHAWQARNIRIDAAGAPLPPIRALAEDPAVDLSLVLTEPDGRLHRFRADGTPLGFAPEGMAASGWRRIVAVDCTQGGGFWLALHADGTIERRGRADLQLEGRAVPLPGALALAWTNDGGEERLIVLFADRLGWFRPQALGLRGCAGEQP